MSEDLADLFNRPGSSKRKGRARSDKNDAISIRVEELLDKPDVHHLRRLRLLGIGVVRLRKGSWACALVGDYNLWWLPARRGKQEAVEAARKVLQQMAEGARRAHYDHPPARGVITRPKIETLRHLADDMRREARIERAASAGPVRRSLPKQVRDLLLTVRPFWPADEAGDALLRIADEYEVPVPEIFDAWMSIQRVHPDGPLIVAEFDSGRRVYLDSELSDSLDKLIDDLLSETMELVVHGDPPASWKGYFELVNATLNSQVERVTTNGMHEAMVLFALQSLLARDGYDRFIGHMEEAFPHLKASPDRLAAAIANAKRAAVLVLGKDDDESLIRLEEICTIVEEKLGLTAILIKEQPELEDHGLVGKLLIYATMTRYVIVENSMPSAHLFELPYVRTAEAVVVVLQEVGKGSSRMPDDSLAKNPLVRVFGYQLENLEVVLREASSWAEERLRLNTEINRQAWPWLQQRS